jgi:hypothetical protein
MHMMEDAPTTTPTEMPAPTTPRPLDDPRALQILAAEQSSLIAARSLNQTEMAGRASMFVAALSGSVVAIAFLAQATQFGTETVAFALLLLPVVLFIGVTTFLRAVDLAVEEVRWVAALNLVRAAYAEAVPGLGVYFATLRDDPRSGVVATLSPARQRTTAVYGIATTPGVIAVIDSVLAGAIAGVVAQTQLGSLAAALVGAAIVFVLVLAAQFAYGTRTFARALARAGDR